MMGPTRVLIWDPCPFGLPEVLTVAHMPLCALQLKYSSDKAVPVQLLHRAAQLQASDPARRAELPKRLNPSIYLKTTIRIPI